MKNANIISLIILLALSQFTCSKQNSPAANATATGDTTATVSPTVNSTGETLPPPSTQDAQGYFALGTELYKQNQDEQAAEAFEQATTLEPDFAAAYLKLGLTYRALGRKEEADKAYKQAVKVYEKLTRNEPKNAEAQLSLGDAYSRTGDYQKSIEAYRRGVRLKEPDSTTFYDIGLTYNKLARYSEAVNAFKKSIELDPNDFRAQEALERAQVDARRQKVRVEEEKKKLAKLTKGNKNLNANSNANSTNNKNQSPKNTNRKT